MINLQRFVSSGILVKVVIISTIAGASWLVIGNKIKPAQPSFITNFDECVAAGNPVMETFPETCSANGQTFSKQINSYQECISAGYPMLKSSPSQCEANGRRFTSPE